LCRVRGRLRQAAHCGDHVFAPQCASLRRSLSYDEFGQSRSASHCRNASLRLESGLDDPSACHFQAESNYVAAHRVLDLASRIGVGQIARMPRILKVIEKLRRVHPSIVPMQKANDVILRWGEELRGPATQSSQGPVPAVLGNSVFAQMLVRVGLWQR